MNAIDGFFYIAICIYLFIISLFVDSFEWNSPKWNHRTGSHTFAKFAKETPGVWEIDNMKKKKHWAIAKWML